MGETKSVHSNYTVFLAEFLGRISWQGAANIIRKSKEISQIFVEKEGTKLKKRNKEEKEKRRNKIEKAAGQQL